MGAQVVETRGRMFGWVMRMCQFSVMLFAVLVLTWTIESLAVNEGRLLANRYIVQVIDPSSLIPGADSSTVRILVYQSNGGFPTSNSIYRLVMCSLLLLTVFSEMYFAVFMSKMRMVMVFLGVFSVLFFAYLGSWILDIVLLAQTIQECSNDLCTKDVPVEFVGAEFQCTCSYPVFTTVIITGTTLLMISTCFTVAVFVYVAARRAALPVHKDKADNL